MRREPSTLTSCLKWLAVGALGLAVLPAPAPAAPIHHWRFESDPGFLLDSIGTAHLTDFNGPTQFALPATGRGSSFGVLLPGNESAALYDYDLEVLGTVVDPPTGDFTIEVFAHFDDFLGSYGDHLAGTASGGTAYTIGWTLEVRFDGYAGTQPHELVLFLVDEVPVLESVNSGIVLETGKDYAIAAIVRMQARNVTFLVQNLTDAGPLQIVIVPHSREAINPIDQFGIGSFTNLSLLTMTGLIDEVRYSDSALGFSELLNPPPPCPGDIDGDGDTDVLDFSTFASNFAQTVPAGTNGDLDGNGYLDVFDFALFVADFGCPFN